MNRDSSSEEEQAPSDNEEDVIGYSQHGLSNAICQSQASVMASQRYVQEPPQEESVVPL